MKTLSMAISGCRSALVSLSLLFAALLPVSTTASAATLSLGSVSNPTFSGGTLTASTPAGIVNGALSVTVTIGDIGAPAQLFVAAYIPTGSLGMTQDTWLCMTSDGWQSVGTAFTPVGTGLAAGSSWKVTLLQNADFSSLPKAEVYVGYGTSLTEMLQTSRYKAVAAVR